MIKIFKFARSNDDVFCRKRINLQQQSFKAHEKKEKKSKITAHLLLFFYCHCDVFIYFKHRLRFSFVLN